MAIALGQATGIARLAIEKLASSAGFEDISFAITGQMATIQHIDNPTLIEEILIMGWNESEQQVPADLAFLSSLCRQALPTLSPLRFRGPADAMDEIRHTVTGTVIKFVEAGFNGHVVVTARDISLHNGVPFVSPVHCLAEIVLQCSAPTRAAVQRARLLRPVARDYQGLTDSNSPLRLTSFQWDAILSKLPHFVELAGDAGIDWYILFGCYGEARELV